MIIVFLITATGFAGCKDKGEEKITGKSDQKKMVELAYVEWSCATASANVVKAVLQEKMGYQVELTPVSAASYVASTGNWGRGRHYNGLAADYPWSLYGESQG